MVNGDLISPLIAFTGQFLAHPGTAFALLRIDHICLQLVADLGTALLVHDVFHILVAECADGADNRQRCAFAETAESCAGDHVCQNKQFIQVFRFAFAFYDTLQNFQHTCGTFAAWYAFAAAFSLCKVHKEAGNLYHAGVLIHNDHTAGPDDGPGFFEGVKIQTEIQVFLSSDSRRTDRPAVRL